MKCPVCKEEGMMATSYTLSLGYNSGYGSDEDPWEVLRDAVNEVTAGELYKEYQGPGAGGNCRASSMAEIMTMKPVPDASIKVYEEEQTVRLLASGTGVARAMKEHMRRAFIRCILRRTDKHGIDVDVSSA